MLQIDFTKPQWLINVYFVMAGISVNLNILGIYLIWFQCKRLGIFRYYLLAFQILCFSMDFGLTILVQPIPLYPIVGAYCVGILSWFPFPPRFIMVVGSFLTGYQQVWLLICYLKKHQAMAEVLNYHLAPAFFEHILHILSISGSVINSFIWYILYKPREEQLDYVAKNYPELLSGFQSQPLAEFYIRTPELDLYLFFSGFAVGLVILFLLATILDIFVIMKKLKRKISAVSFQRHQEAIRSLIIQTGTSVLCISALGCLQIVILLKTSDAQFLSELVAVWFSTHSSINMAALLIFFPPFKAFVKQTFKRAESTRIKVEATANTI